MSGAFLDALAAGDPPELWADLGFELSDSDRTRVGTVEVELKGSEAGPGLLGWTLAAIDAPVGSLDLDGLATTVLADPRSGAPGAHPNGVTSLDHVVVTTPDLERTVAALGRLGIDERRRRDTGRPGGSAMVQVFFRLGPVILELVGPAEGGAGDEARGAGPARLWGLAFNVTDLDVTAAVLGSRLRDVKSAVQPGRFIATLDRAAGSTVDMAFMTT